MHPRRMGLLLCMCWSSGACTVFPVYMRAQGWEQCAGAIAGIAVGAGLALLAVVAVGAAVCLRRRRGAAPPPETGKLKVRGGRLGTPL